MASPPTLGSTTSNAPEMLQMAGTDTGLNFLLEFNIALIELAVIGKLKNDEVLKWKDWIKVEKRTFEAEPNERREQQPIRCLVRLIEVAIAVRSILLLVFSYPVHFVHSDI